MHYNTICQYMSVYLKGSTASSPAIYLRSWNINPQCVLLIMTFLKALLRSIIITLDLEGESCLWGHIRQLTEMQFC